MQQYTIIVSPQTKAFPPRQGLNSWPPCTRPVLKAGRPGKEPRKIVAMRVRPGMARRYMLVQ